MKNCILCKKELDPRTIGEFCKECIISNSELNPNFKGGLAHCQICGKELSKSGTQKQCKYCVECFIKRNKGKNHPNFKGGKSKCLDCGEKLSNYGAKRCRDCWYKFNQGNNNSNFKGKNKCIDCGNKISYGCKNREITRCWSCYCKWSKIPENNPNWNNGSSFVPYSIDFTKALKEKIRKRDNYTCQNCGMSEEEHLIVASQELHVHHIDYNKKNCKENNLITACLWCNTRANHNRIYWESFYKEKIKRLIS